MNADLAFLNYWGLNAALAYRPEVCSGIPTRGGPLMLEPAVSPNTLRGNTDPRAPLTVAPSAQFRRSTADASRSFALLTIRSRP